MYSLMHPTAMKGAAMAAVMKSCRLRMPEGGVEAFGIRALLTGSGKGTTLLSHPRVKR